MSYCAPFNTNYVTVRKFENTAFYCLVCSAIIIGSLWTLSKFDLSIDTKEKLKQPITHLKIFSYISMTSYFILSNIGKFLFKHAEKIKRDDLIDNSFGTNYSDSNSNGYYNNDDITNGIKKFAMNAYESSFHTENTLREMLLKMSIKIALLSAPFLLSIFTPNGEGIIRLLFEISIPVVMISQYAITINYFLTVKSINDRFKIELINIGQSDLAISDYPKLLIPIMEYYNTKSWANINLDSKIFQKHNDRISIKWLEIKTILNIE